ncbi:MAG: PEP-CTERM sorting domain-containing protein [Planctomycetes bacterium]|nr:PEP-CTERM sorting domain-containing protein [Planctomycetota bacterium]MCK5472824.1 PEP-CTERM sorting domain-containing protein [Planctomycetota bacterium]
MGNLVRKFVFLLLFFVAVSICMAGSASAATIEFTPDNTGAGGWHYDGAGTLSFVQNITVDRGLGVSSDILAGAFVHIPNMTVGGSGGLYTLTGGTISITSSSTPGAGTTYLTGTLGVNSMITFGSVGIAYPVFQADITGITINNGIGSAALATIGSTLDFELAMTGGTGGSFGNMLDSGLTGDGSFSGAMAVPEPATLILLGIGGLAALRRNKEKEGRC